jgi:thiol-disulfide isomerase/thioredoxin
MWSLIASTAFAVLTLCTLLTDDRPSEKPGRAVRLKAIQSDFKKSRDEMSKAIRAGTIKPNAAGDYPQWTELQRKFVKPVRELIDADPTDAVALDALVFCLNDLGAGGTEPGLYGLVLKHLARSEKIEPLLASAPLDFLEKVVARSPHAKIQVWACYHLAEKLNAAGKTQEAEQILEFLGREPAAQEQGGYGMGSLADTANRLLFELRRLNVGQEIPEIAGPDLDRRMMKLSDSRGKVTLLVFWATWCRPCMAMVPHERALAERYAAKPFVIVGVNGDTLSDERVKATSAGGKEIDDTIRVKAAIEKHRITWRSFRNGQFGVGMEWNVRSWPTVYLIDHRGIIRGKWKGDPGEKELDVAVDKVMKVAEAEKNKADK